MADANGTVRWRAFKALRERHPEEFELLLELELARAGRPRLVRFERVEVPTRSEAELVGLLEQA